MSVEFIDPSQTPGFILKQKHLGDEPRGLIGFLIKRGIVNNETQANYVLLGFSLILISITIYFIIGFIKAASIPIATTSEILEKTQKAEKAFITQK